MNKILVRNLTGTDLFLIFCVAFVASVGANLSWQKDIQQGTEPFKK